jgi:hypothetical protein
MWHSIFSSIREDRVAVADFRAAAVSLVEEARQVVAGRWGFIEPGDVESALQTASAIGDDRLQRQNRAAPLARCAQISTCSDMARATELLHLAAAEALHEHVGAGNKTLLHPVLLGVLEIEQRRAHADVHVHHQCVVLEALNSFIWARMALITEDR